MSEFPSEQLMADALAEHLASCADCHERDRRGFKYSMCPRGTVLARRVQMEEMRVALSWVGAIFASLGEEPRPINTRFAVYPEPTFPRRFVGKITASGSHDPSDRSIRDPSLERRKDLEAQVAFGVKIATGMAEALLDGFMRAAWVEIEEIQASRTKGDREAMRTALARIARFAAMGEMR